MRRQIVIERAERLHQIPPYPTRELLRYKRRLAARGIDPIDLSVGALEFADQPAATNRLCDAIREAGASTPADFREAFCAWFARRFDVDLDPAEQVLPLVGAKTGVACLPMALLNPGETVLVPDPAYPAYRTATIFAGGHVHTVPLVERNDYLPNLKQIDTHVAHRAKLMFLSYPNNPTGAVADLQFFREAVDFAKTHNVIICHDATHLLLGHDGYEAPSFMQAPGAVSVGIEIISLAALIGQAGCDLSVAVGNPASLAALGQLTDNLDVNLFPVIQRLGIEALKQEPAASAAVVQTYTRRRDALVEGLQALGWRLRKPKAGVYVWAPVPPRYSSVRFSVLLRKAGVFVVPGAYLGEYGEGYVRFALNTPESRLQTVVQRVKQSLSRRRLRWLQTSQFSMA